MSILWNLFKIKIIIITTFSFNYAFAVCNFDEVKKLEFDNYFDKIHLINIKVSDYRSWTKNSMKIIKDNKNYISNKYKKKFKAKLIIESILGKCQYSAYISQTGDLKDHLENHYGNIINSINVEIKDGNVSGIVKFKLLLQNTRKSNNEIIATKILRSLGYLAPRTKLLNIDINGNKYITIFQESISKEMLEFNRRKEGAIFEGDETKLFESEYDYNVNEILSLTKVKNYKWLIKSEQNKYIALKGYLKLQEAYLFTFSKHFGNKNYYNLNWNILNSAHNFSAVNYELLIIAMGGEHSLHMHNRKFYFDSIKNNFEPIYYDGNVNPNIDVYNKITLNHLALLGVNEKNVNYLIKELNRVSELDPSLSDSIDKILLNLNNYPLHINTEVKNYSQKLNLYNEFLNRQFYYYPNSTVYLINEKLLNASYKHQLSKIQVDKCTNSQCVKLSLSLSEVSEIIARKIPDQLILPSTFESINRNIVSFNGGKINILFPSTSKVVYSKNRIKLIQQNIDDKFLLFDSILDNFTIEFIGVPFKRINDSMRHKNNIDGLTGCVTLLDSAFDNLKIIATNSNCEDAFNFVRANGSISYGLIRNSAEDAIDLDFSNVKFNFINIDTAGNDCIDFSQGSYEINNFSLQNCMDKGISVGEKSNALIMNGKIKSLGIGIATKDSSQSNINNVTISTKSECTKNYVKKIEFDFPFSKENNLICN